MTEYVKAWQYIGCGKIEAPQTCVGICQDREVELVSPRITARRLATCRRRYARWMRWSVKSPGPRHARVHGKAPTGRYISAGATLVTAACRT